MASLECEYYRQSCTSQQLRPTNNHTSSPGLLRATALFQMRCENWRRKVNGLNRVKMTTSRSASYRERYRFVVIRSGKETRVDRTVIAIPDHMSQAHPKPCQDNDLLGVPVPHETAVCPPVFQHICVPPSCGMQANHRMLQMPQMPGS